MNALETSISEKKKEKKKEVSELFLAYSVIFLGFIFKKLDVFVKKKN